MTTANGKGLKCDALSGQIGERSAARCHKSLKINVCISAVDVFFLFVAAHVRLFYTCID